MKKIFVMVYWYSVFVIAGCSEKKVRQPEQPEMEQQQQSSTVPERSQGEKRYDQARGKDNGTAACKNRNKRRTCKYKEESGLFKDIYFDFDKYDVREDAKAVLQSVASWLLKNTSAKILIEGHCDERGTNEYNLALGDRRAKAVRDYLVALGIASNRVETISYGEEKPRLHRTDRRMLGKKQKSPFCCSEGGGQIVDSQG